MFPPELVAEYLTVEVPGVRVPLTVRTLAVAPALARVRVYPPVPKSRVSAEPDVPSMVKVSTVVVELSVSLLLVGGETVSVLLMETIPRFCGVVVELM